MATSTRLDRASMQSTPKRPDAWTARGSELPARVFALALAAAAVSLSCEKSSTAPGTPDPADPVISIVAGDNQVAPVRETLPVALSVRVSDEHGDPLEGRQVTFAVILGGGTLTGASQITDAAGVATVGGWTLGSSTGLQSVRALLSQDIFVDFNADALPGPPTQMVKSAGDGDLGTVELPARIPPRVTVTDLDGNPVSDIRVHFEVTGGGGSATGLDQVTGGGGSASVGSWLLGPDVGTNTMSATLPDLPELGTVVFSVETVLPIAVGLEIADGNGQGVATGREVIIPPAVLVVDAAGNGVGGVGVQFTVAAGGGSVTGPNAVSDEMGLAAAGGWRMGAQPVENRLVVTAPGQPELGAVTLFAFPALPGGYNIRLEHVNPLTATEQAALQVAKDFWEDVLIDEFPSINLATSPIPAGLCNGVDPLGVPHPAYNSGVIDEVLLITQRRTIGTGVIARAGPCANRVINGQLTPFTAIGVVTLDPAASTAASQQGLLEEVFIHEIGHALGFGSAWQFFLNPVNPSLSLGAGAETFFGGPAAQAAFLKVGGDDYDEGPIVPVDNSGIPGRADAHWRKSVFDSELMTGILNPGPAPFSLVSVGAMHDILLTVDPDAAQAFVLPDGLTAAPGLQGLDLGDHVLDGPHFWLHEDGRFTATAEMAAFGAPAPPLTREAVWRWKQGG